MRLILFSMIALVVAVGCSSSPKAAKTASPAVVAKASEAQTAELLGRIKILDGTWEMIGPDGQKSTIIFKTVSGGTAVREIMFPGTGHEMTNMYHMDGPSIVMTHFCAAGNQPRMRATAFVNNSIAFTSDSVSNLTSMNDQYMGAMTLVFKDADHIEERWQHMAGDKVSHGPNFELTRVK